MNLILRRILWELKGLLIPIRLKNSIHIDSAIEWAQENSKPVSAYKRNSRAAKEYFALAKEVDGLAGRNG